MIEISTASVPVDRPTLTLDQTTATLGGFVTATITNLNPANVYTIYIDDVVVSTSVASSVVIPVGRDLRPGAQHTVAVVDMTMGSGNGLTHATAQLAIAAPTATATVATNADGNQQVSVQGAGWAPNQVVSMTVDQQSLGNALVLPDGTFALTSGAKLPPAVHTVLVTSQDGVEKAVASVTTHK